MRPELLQLGQGKYENANVLDHEGEILKNATAGAQALNDG
jgi:hypothetical protein